MKTALVGATGFVGGNLAASHAFDGLYHSTNVEKAYGTHPDLLVYAGMPAAKYLANTDPEGDWAVACGALENMRRIAPGQLVLISTVDVYRAPLGADEDTPADPDNPAAYGRNRARLEQAVREEFPEALIVRLPALFGAGLKKNFLYDLLTLVPAMLKADKYAELAAREALVARGYEDANNGFYRLCAKGEDAAALRAWFEKNDFNALSFTDSRAEYQFYDLSLLWRDITIALAHGLTLLNLTAAPVRAGEVYEYLTHGGRFVNELPGEPARYDMRTKHAALFGGENGYCLGREEELARIAAFAAAARRQMGGDA